MCSGDTSSYISEHLAVLVKAVNSSSVIRLRASSVQLKHNAMHIHYKANCSKFFQNQRYTMTFLRVLDI